MQAVRSAIEAMGLAQAPMLAFDLAAPIAGALRTDAAFVDLDRARAWAARPLVAPDAAPRSDGTHMNTLFAHLREAQQLDPAGGRQAGREGPPLPMAAELDAMLVIVRAPSRARWRAISA